LVSLLGSTKGLPLTAVAQLQQWALLVVGYQYDIQFKPTQKHGNTDGLSHLPLTNSSRDSDDEIETTLFNIVQIDCLPVTAEQ